MNVLELREFCINSTVGLGTVVLRWRKNKQEKFNGCDWIVLIDNWLYKVSFIMKFFMKMVEVIKLPRKKKFSQMIIHIG